MPPCERCAGDAWLRDAGFELVDRDHRRYAIRGELVYEVPAACREHAPAEKSIREAA